MNTLPLLLMLAADWPAKVDLRHDDEIFVTYQARLEGDTLVVHTKMAPTWHTYTMDNRIRAEEKLAGKKALAMDKPTVITVAGGRAVDGGWMQAEPVDFSKPELRLYAWGYESEAVFAVKTRAAGAGPVEIGIKAQVCTPSTCRMVDTTLQLPAGAPVAAPEKRTLIPVRTK